MMQTKNKLGFTFVLRFVYLSFSEPRVYKLYASKMLAILRSFYGNAIALFNCHSALVHICCFIGFT